MFAVPPAASATLLPPSNVEIVASCGRMLSESGGHIVCGSKCGSSLSRPFSSSFSPAGSTHYCRVRLTLPSLCFSRTGLARCAQGLGEEGNTAPPESPEHREAALAAKARWDIFHVLSTFGVPKSYLPLFGAGVNDANAASMARCDFELRSLCSLNHAEVAPVVSLSQRAL